ncbi:F-box domain-containing protein [Mycena kentingensis (nom. inval.)]|nr:F-box domain-containing protein [Mycena kentingensis (nom. inval.)]
MSAILKRRKRLAQLPPFLLLELPPELLLEVLDAMDDASLHTMAIVSKQFHTLAVETLLRQNNLEIGSRAISIDSSEGLRALRLALAIPGTQTPLDKLEYVPRGNGASNAGSKDLARLQAISNLLASRRIDIPDIFLTFSHNPIKRPVPYRMAIEVPRLLQSLCGRSSMAVIVANTSIFTYAAQRLRLWNPYTRELFCKLQMHDRSYQWVPTIQSILSLHAHHPFGSFLAIDVYGQPPILPMTLLIVNKADINTLLLSVELTHVVWSVILRDPALFLPALHTVAIWSVNIIPSTSIPLLERHRETLVSLTYMSPVAPVALLIGGDPKPTEWPKLDKITALSHYIAFLFSALKDPPRVHFPALREVELWPTANASGSDSYLPSALRAISNHTGVSILTIWCLAPRDLAFTSGQWPVFSTITALRLNKTTTISDPTGLARLLARSFPALRSLMIDDSFTLAAAGLKDTKRAAQDNALKLEEWREDVRRAVLEGHNGRSGVECGF